VIEINEEESKIESQLMEALQSNTEQPESTDLYELSDREREVLVELSKGLTNKEIAEKLHISVHTAITHRKNIIKKTGIKSVAGLTVYAMLNNLIE
jgi:DNA-binding NarL/FixJ family response regulator